MYSISPGLAATQNISQNYYISKQFIAIGAGLLAFIFFSSLSLKRIKRSKRALIWLSFILVAAVQIFGEKVNGAYRWIQIGGFSLQIAEVVKVAIIVWIACFLVDRLRGGEMRSSKNMLSIQ